MKTLTKPTFKKIMQKSGRMPTSCACDRCKQQCRTPCLGTPEDIQKLIEAGYGSRLALTEWRVGMMLGVIDRPVMMIQALVEENGWCTFRTPDGLCELHDKGLKPTEGRLSHHTIALDNFDPKRSLAWLVAKEWLPLQKEFEKR